MEPSDGFDTAHIEPPFWRTIFSHMARPMPVPGRFGAVKSRKRLENGIRVFFLEALAVVCNRYDPEAILAFGGDGDARRLWTAVFNGVRDQVLKRQDQLGTVGDDVREAIVGDDSAVIPNQRRQVRESLGALTRPRRGLGLRSDYAVGGVSPVRVRPACGAQMGCHAVTVQRRQQP
ncbi:MAG: hypothetical protein JWN34_1956 [Bryobacterales bacterium]|nr:hypothetical protein [Bryobacterales bacterium]